MLSSNEVLAGNFPASRRFTSSHTGIDYICQKGTLCLARYPGVITEVKRNPIGVDWGLFVRIKYDSSEVIGAYAHLSKSLVYKRNSNL